ncbi:MAG: NAD(P)-binding domain-containing protein [Candidatus Kerfeldbacteria bacterium]
MKENVENLEQWLAQAKNLADELRTRARADEEISTFTVSTTSKATENLAPYLTPLRHTTYGYIAGAVVFSHTQAILLTSRIDGLVDHILIDAEHKIGIHNGIDGEALAHFGVSAEFPEITGANGRKSNLTVACAPVITESHFQDYKPNDMTVEAAWHFLSNYFQVLSGKRIAIIGSGNIGFKLGLKLVESGCHVELVRRDPGKGRLMAEAIDLIKPRATAASGRFNPDPLDASKECDVLIGCTDGTAVITWEMMENMKPDGLVIDIAKGSVFKDAVEKAFERNITILRCDISSAIDGYVSAMHRNKDVLNNKMGRREIGKGVFVGSGGYMGLEGDIIVDDFRHPQRIIGIADGMGDLERNYSEEDRQKIERLEELINRGEA